MSSTVRGMVEVQWGDDSAMKLFPWNHIFMLEPIINHLKILDEVIYFIYCPLSFSKDFLYFFGSGRAGERERSISV